LGAAGASDALGAFVDPAPSLAAGAGCTETPGCEAGLRLSKIVADGRRPAKYPRVSDVIMKIIAIAVVSFVRKFPAPLLPKIVELEPPPKTAPISAPLPVCSKTTSINPIQTIMCRIVTAITIILLVIEATNDREKSFRF
jgi:hypothetical protein